MVPALRDARALALEQRQVLSSLPGASTSSSSSSIVSSTSTTVATETQTSVTETSVTQTSVSSIAVTTEVSSGSGVITIVIELSNPPTPTPTPTLTTSSSSISSTSSSSSSSSSSNTGLTSPLPPPATATDGAVHKGLSKGDVTAISVCSTAGGLALLVLLFFLFRRWTGSRREGAFDSLSQSSYPDGYGPRAAGDQGNFPQNYAYRDAEDHNGNGPEMSEYGRPHSDIYNGHTP